jgi:hypothetical protein
MLVRFTAPGTSPVETAVAGAALAVGAPDSNAAAGPEEGRDQGVKAGAEEVVADSADGSGAVEPAARGSCETAASPIAAGTTSANASAASHPIVVRRARDWRVIDPIVGGPCGSVDRR